jgi:homoserine dehydrogenase
MLRGMKRVGIGLLGCGTVGSAALRLLAGPHLSERVGAELRVRRVLVRDPNKPRAGCDPAWLTTDPSEVLDDPEIDVVVEVMGGEAAGPLVERALAAKKSVVTANKLLVAKHARELLERARAARADLAFEGAVGGGIPIVRTLREAFASDRVTRLCGILNGTSNYVLTRMLDAGLDMPAAIREAQDLGYAEADPSLDIDGHDAAHKLGILAMLAFGAEVPFGAVPVEGLRAIEAVDHRFAQRFGYRIKPLVVGRDHGDDVELRVHPALVPERSVLANVSGSLNAVLCEGEALGPCLVYGRGAGGLPTAVSVVSDVLDAARSIVAGAAGLGTGAVRFARRPLRAPGDAEARFYLRFTVRDEPGVLARLAGQLGAERVSIEQLVQVGEEGRPPLEGGPATVVMLTHRARAAAVRAAVGEAPFMLEAPRVLPIEDV